MLKIFIGFIFTLFDFNIANFDILADFAGYILIYFGFKEFPNIFSFQKAKPLTIVLLAASLIECIAAVMGLAEDETLSIVFSAVDIVLTVVSLYLIYLIVKGIQEIEQQTKLDLDSAKLYSLWKVQAVMLLVCAVLTAVAALSAVAAMELISAVLAVVIVAFAIATLVINIKFLVHLYRVKKALDTYRPEEDVPEGFYADGQQNGE